MQLASRSRRHFLRGAGGFVLGLPFLESLQERPAHAGDPPFSATPRFVGMMTRQGGVWGSNMFPGDDAAPNTATLYPGHVARHGTLSLTTQGNDASLSRVLTAPADKLTPAIASKMNLLRGLDIPWYMAHQWGAIMGNFEAGGIPRAGRPTVDQILAYSPSFYTDAASVRLRSMQIGSEEFGGMAWGYADPANPQTSAIQAVPAARSSRQLFDQIFVPDNTEPERPRVVDRVIANYREVSNGSFGHAARLSSADRALLDAHMDRLRDLEVRLGAVASCGDVPTPVDDAVGFPPYDVAGLARFYQLYNDVIVAAFMCGTSRIATIMAWESFSDVPGIGDWHEDIAHQSVQPDGVAQGILADGHRNFFEHVFLDLTRKLDVVEADDKTYLDNSLLYWTQECGEVTHECNTYPVIAAGSGAGFVRTGVYADYRNRDNLSIANFEYLPIYAERRPGILYSQWLSTVLQAMGVPPSEYERPGERGCLEPYCENANAWPSHLFDAASDPLPFLAP